MLTPKRAQDLVNVALQTKAPALYRELPQYGTLDQFIAELAHEMLEFAAAQVDRVLARAAQSSPLDSLQSTRSIHSDVETPAQIRRTVEKALELYPPERVFLNPDCGFGTFSSRPMNTPEVASAKIAAMVAAARELRGRT